MEGKGEWEGQDRARDQGPGQDQGEGEEEGNVGFYGGPDGDGLDYIVGDPGIIEYEIGTTFLLRHEGSPLLLHLVGVWVREKREEPNRIGKQTDHKQDEH